MPLALMKPMIDAIQKLGRSLWYDVTGAQWPVESPLLTSGTILTGSAHVLRMACAGAAQVITLKDCPVPRQLVNMESVLMICLVCLG